jgi:hypothetical protein
MLVSAEAREQRQMAAVEQRPCHKLVPPTRAYGMPCSLSTAGLGTPNVRLRHTLTCS